MTNDSIQGEYQYFVSLTHKMKHRSQNITLTVRDTGEYVILDPLKNQLNRSYDKEQMTMRFLG